MSPNSAPDEVTPVENSDAVEATPRRHPVPTLVVGDRVEVDVDSIAHGGHFIARYQGQVIFVRHAIPGERVEVEITSVSSKVVRADAISVITPSEFRVEAPCKFAHPGGCGGCDFQHIEISHQRTLKAQVVKEQFSRVGKIDLEALGIDVIVEGVAPASGLDWRTRMDFAISENGRIGFYKNRSKEVVEISDCLIAVEEMAIPELAKRKWSGDARVEAAVSRAGEVNISRGGRSLSGPTQLHETVLGRTLTVSPQSFWQAHRSAAETLTARAIELLNLKKGDTVCDLYGGVGLFSIALADAVGQSGKVHLVESDRRAIADAISIFAKTQQVIVHSGTVESHIAKLKKLDAILLDPPRTGAGEMVIETILKMGGDKPGRIVYVSCDPASLARDAKFLTDGGYRLESLVGFDLFPMTQHVESIASFILA